MNKHFSHSHLKLYVKISSVDTRLDDIGASNGHKKIAVKRAYGTAGPVCKYRGQWGSQLLADCIEILYLHCSVPTRTGLSVPETCFFM